MAFRKENKIKTGFSKISIGLASPEEILEKSPQKPDIVLPSGKEMLEIIK